MWLARSGSFLTLLACWPLENANAMILWEVLCRLSHTSNSGGRYSLSETWPPKAAGASSETSPSAARVAIFDAACPDPAATQQQHQACIAGAMQGCSAVIVLLEAGSFQRQHRTIQRRLQAMAAHLPEGLTIPLLEVVCGEEALSDEHEALLRELLPQRPDGAQPLAPWAVFLAQEAGQVGEALGQGLLWLAQHGPAQPDLQVAPARAPLALGSNPWLRPAGWGRHSSAPAPQPASTLQRVLTNEGACLMVQQSRPASPSMAESC